MELLHKAEMKLNVKYFLKYLLLFTCVTVSAQDYYSEDTIKIGEVFISGKRSIKARAGYKTTSIDSSVLDAFNLGSVSELLSGTTPLFIKSYGPGGVATPSFRGTGAGNTRVLWNGLSIDHPMLGQSDLSLMPAGLADQIDILYGGSSMELASGASGGIISLETKPVWEKQSALSINAGSGSYGKYSGLVSGRTGTVNLQSVTKAFFLSDYNRFPYTNSVYGPDPKREIRKFNELGQTGVTQELYYRRSGNVLSAKVWYQDTWRNLPGNILSPTNELRERQHDKSFRSVIDYDHSRINSNLSITAGWLKTRLDYFNSSANIDSRNLADTWVIKADFNTIIDGFNIRTAFNESFDVIHSNNYSGKAQRNSADMLLSVQTMEMKRLRASVLAREILLGNKLLIPDYSAGLQFRIIESREYYLKANASRTSRIPTLNDMYWNPGGNRNLRNEYAFIYEAGFGLNEKLSDGLNIDYDLTVYRNNINDMIKWHPGEYSYWTADNISRVISQGLETSLSLKLTMNQTSAFLNGAYSYTMSETAAAEGSSEDAGKQLIYVPVNQASGSLRVKRGIVYSEWRTGFTGIRFVSSDNSEYLPSHTINYVSAGIRKESGWGAAEFCLSIDNLFNVDYQNIAWYPMPGRTWLFKMMFQITK